MPKISISLERNNLSKKAKVFQVDQMLKQVQSDKDLLDESFEHLCDLPQGYSAYLDLSWGMIAIVDKNKAPVGGISFEERLDFISTTSIKLTQEAQGKGLVFAVLEHILKEHGGIFSSDSISPGAAITFKKLADKYRGFIVWPAASTKAWTPISSWGLTGIYKVFPFVKAPDGKEYPVDEIEDSIGKNIDKTYWKRGEIFISKNKKPPVGMKQI